MKNQRNHIRYSVGLILALVGLMSAATLVLSPSRLASAQVVGPSWNITGNLNHARYFHTATLLQNGKVLVAGGSSGNTAELYDPATGTWSSTGNLNTPRDGHTATLLPNGKVLIVGANNTDSGGHYRGLNSAELYDPDTGTWSITGNLNIARHHHTATLLPNGKVLVAGGEDYPGRSTELYNPATGTWSFTGNLNKSREDHTATLLLNGKVLVAGSFVAFGGAAELYDPATETWSFTGSNSSEGSDDRMATLLPNGKVLVAGGIAYFCGSFLCDDFPTKSAELYDPATGTWSNTGNLNYFSGPVATLLQNGKVLTVAGQRAQLYDPATGTWSITASLNLGRSGHTATLLPNGKVLVAAGSTDSGYENTAELYDPGTSSTPNPIDDVQFFIRQQYQDFLQRQPEPGPDGIFGTADDPLKFYLDILNGCQPTDIECIKYTRGALSANFFRSPEFQRKGSYVMYLYMVSIGQRPVTPSELPIKNDPLLNDRPHYAEFFAELGSISTPNDDPALTETRKAALADAWMQSSQIQALYPAAPTMTNAQFVQKLLDTAGVTNSNQGQLVTDLNNQARTRAQVLRIIAESPEVNAKFYKQAFVTMEYFGYLGRDPEDCHNSQNWTGGDPNQCGFIFHNNRFNLGFDPAQVENVVVRGFIESPEYRRASGRENQR